MEEIASSSFGSLDPHICQVFLKKAINYYHGCAVRLSNQLVGEIVYINPGEWTRPTIRCGDRFINPVNERNLEIIEVLS